MTSAAHAGRSAPAAVARHTSRLDHQTMTSTLAASSLPSGCQFARRRSPRIQRVDGQTDIHANRNFGIRALPSPRAAIMLLSGEARRSGVPPLEAPRFAELPLHASPTITRRTSRPFHGNHASRTSTSIVSCPSAHMMAMPPRGAFRRVGLGRRQLRRSCFLCLPATTGGPCAWSDPTSC